MRNRYDIVVVGSGVIGLTTAIVLQHAGLRVKIITKARHLETTSANAGAIWGPFLSAIDSRVLEWTFRSLREFVDLCQTPGTGVQMVRGLLATDREVAMPLWMRSLGKEFASEEPDLPAHYTHGWRYTVPIIDMPVYLEYLATRFQQQGGVIHESYVTNMDDVAAGAHHVVNCSGLGARDLASDCTVVPYKGQLVVVENPGITEFFGELGDGPDLVNIMPQGDKVVLGGSVEKNESTESVDLLVARAIIQRCVRVAPCLSCATVLSHRVGLRPYRDTVRLEHEITNSGTHVVHNYGHAGSGVSLSWACASAVLECIMDCGVD